MIRRLVFIGFRYPHHGRYSGYDRLAAWLPYDLVLHPDRFLCWKGAYRLATRCAPLKLGKYTLLDPLKWFYTLFNVFCSIRTSGYRKTCFHFAYPETGLCFRRKNNGKGNRYVATLHLPPESQERLHPHIRERIRRMDHHILMSKDLASAYPEVPSIFIPHGTDTNYFHPDEGKIRNIDILLLGNWLRDYPLAARVITRLGQSRPGLRVAAIAKEENLAPLREVPGVQCHHSISDDRLRDMLQRTKVLFLPLKGLTANNALLEAAACGCRIALSLPVGTTPDYLEEHLHLLPQDADACAKGLLDLLAGDFNPRKTVKAVRETFGWPVIAERTLQVLKAQYETNDG
jgi:glycosyltransferase involved in cell wall biosynthesis